MIAKQIRPFLPNTCTSQSCSVQIVAIVLKFTFIQVEDPTVHKNNYSPVHLGSSDTGAVEFLYRSTPSH